MTTRTLTSPRNVWPHDYGDDNNGNDLITGTGNRDIIFTGQGDDIVNAQGGDDLVYSGHDNDTLNGGFGNDVLVGEDGDDKINGEANVDTLFGYDGNDSLNGGDHNDFLFGGSMADTLDGGTGDDRLYGEEGSDTLKGGEDNDSLNGGTEQDLLTGGLGNDVFVFANVNDSTLTNPDKILDFATGDRIDLSPIDAKDNTAADDAFNSLITKATGAPVTLAQGALYYDTANQDLYGNVSNDTTADFMIHVGRTDVTAVDFIF
jgi:Ca2+-binding RTX toxin-like protein